MKLWVTNRPGECARMISTCIAIVGGDLFGREAPEVEPRGGIRPRSRSGAAARSRRRNRPPSTRTRCPRLRSVARASDSAAAASLGTRAGPPRPRTGSCRDSRIRCRSASPRPRHGSRIPARGFRRCARSRAARCRTKSCNGGASRSRAAVLRDRPAAISGWRSISHFGGVAVGVPNTTFRPAAPSVSSARRSHAELQAPRLRLDPAPREFADAHKPMPIARMRRASSAHRLSGQCSGY